MNIYFRKVMKAVKKVANIDIHETSITKFKVHTLNVFMQFNGQQIAARA